MNDPQPLALHAAPDQEDRPARVAVVGALVMDLTFWAPRRPEPGETLLGHRFEQFLGGKGFNQAVAAARLGADVALIGAVGRDEYGDRFLAALAEEGVDAGAVVRVGEGTSVGQPLVTDDGEVSILGVPRANRQLSPDAVERGREAIAEADFLLLQCEVPHRASLHAARIAREGGVPVLLNPAPAGPEALVLASEASILVLNLVECRALGADGQVPPEVAAARLRERYDCPVVVTLGSQGALTVRDGTLESLPAHTVEAVDPTGAGDAFCAAYAVALAEGRDHAEALAFANAAGAVAVRTPGAHPSMPDRSSVEDLLGKAEVKVSSRPGPGTSPGGPGVPPGGPGVPSST